MPSASDYVFLHRQAPPDVGMLVLGEDFGSGEQPAPPNTTTAHEYALECIRVLDEARFHTRATDPEGAWNQVGTVVVYLDKILQMTAT